MSSVLDPQPDPAADEIVAYLDGELPPVDCRRVENRLATDEEYRHQLHELDRAWEALDALPANTVDDGFARTTIELACVAAEADLTEHTAIAKAASLNRRWRWIAAGVSAIVIGFLAGRALIPSGNAALLADLPAIHQGNVLPYVEDVEFLRRLSLAVPLEQLIKDEPAFKRNLEELENANSPSIDKRREWVRSLQPEQKSELADRARAFADLEPSSGEQERMRNIMAEIRDANDADRATLQNTLIAYGQWLSRRHTAGQLEQLREELQNAPQEQQAELVRRRIERESEQALTHLTSDDEEKLRQEIFRIAMERRPEFMERARQGRKGDRVPTFEAPLAQQATMIVLAELFKGNNREETAQRLVGTLSSAEQAHWEKLGRGQREFARRGQLFVWIQDAMKPKVDPQDLEKFFASDKLTPEQRQLLLDEPRAKMEADLKSLYFRSQLGIENPGQWFGDLGEPGRRNAPGIRPPPREGAGPDRPPFIGPGREPRPDGGPNERRPRPRRPPPNQTPQDGKQEAI